jgi:hypothetical protein
MQRNIPEDQTFGISTVETWNLTYLKFLNLFPGNKIKICYLFLQSCQTDLILERVPCISLHIEYFNMVTMELHLSYQCQSFSFIASASFPVALQAVLGHRLPLLGFWDSWVLTSEGISAIPIPKPGKSEYLSLTITSLKTHVALPAASLPPA